MELPQPNDLTSLILRTDFSSDAAWEATQAAIDGASPYPQATYVSDPTYDRASVQALLAARATTGGPPKVTHLFLADADTITNEEHPLLAVDLYHEPGRTFRVPPHRFVDVSANLSIANMDFHEFADAVDDTGTFRGFDET